MKQSSVSRTVRVLAALAALVTALSTGASAAGKERVLYAFTGGPDGGQPTASLTLDAAGNLYGTAYVGGSNACLGSCGVVFELTPNPDGTWSESVIYSFSGFDGSNPLSNLTLDSAGNLYGTTYFGGAFGLGTIFELTPTTNGWQESVLYSFGSAPKCRDGANPAGGLIFDAAGNLYGTTQLGADSCGFGSGVAFELTPTGGQSWSEIVLHRFTKEGDGIYLGAGLVFDSAGNLYGTTYYGGLQGGGTLFELTPNPDGTWKETLRHSFVGNNGKNPACTLVFDSDGNLYGTTEGGGTSGDGVVFKLEKSSGHWKEHWLSFAGNDGSAPWAGLTFDVAGNLYGTTRNGGASGKGVVFGLIRTSGGGWQRREFSFTGGGNDGAEPTGSVILDSAGSLYGTTRLGGPSDQGVVFQIMP